MCRNQFETGRIWEGTGTNRSCFNKEYFRKFANWNKDEFRSSTVGSLYQSVSDIDSESFEAASWEAFEGFNPESCKPWSIFLEAKKSSHWYRRGTEYFDDFLEPTVPASENVKSPPKWEIHANKCWNIDIAIIGRVDAILRLALWEVKTVFDSIRVGLGWDFRAAKKNKSWSK